MDIVPDTWWPSLTWLVPRAGVTSYTGLVRASGEQPHQERELLRLSRDLVSVVMGTGS
jgi:hypothetical protein